MGGAVALVERFPVAATQPSAVRPVVVGGLSALQGGVVADHMAEVPTAGEQQARPRYPTIIDVAGVAGVSKSVVSRVVSGQGRVSEATRARVLQAAAELGYVVNASARSMSAHRTFTLGVFVREASTSFYGHLMTAMQERAAARGYRVVAATGAGTLEVAEERKALQTLLMLHVEGLLVCSGLLPVEDVREVGARVPTVMAGRPEADPGVVSVACNEVEGGAAMARHVAELGHRRVLVIRYDATQTLTLAPRSEAISAQLRARGVHVEEVAGTRALETGAVLARLRADPDITAVMSPNDAYAVRLLGHLGREGIAVPGEVSVTGFDGIGPLSEELIGLTTWRQPIELIGAEAVDTLLAMVDGQQVARQQRLAGRFVPGRTAAPPSR